jgi:hypothetical protein
MTGNEDLLRANGITTLRSYATGNYSTTCPRCSHARKRDHQKLPVLSIKIDSAGACWHCHHCGFEGPEKGTGGNGQAPPLKCYFYSESLRKVRNPPGSAQKCHWEHLNGSGEWKDTAGGAKIPLLYRFDEAREAIAAGETIAIVEGEKDADSLWRIGIAATCNSHGASEPGTRPKWTSAHSKQLAGANIVILNDNDATGYAHADAIVKCSTGVAKQVRRLDLKDEWPDIGQGNDVSDWLANGGTPNHLLELIESAPVSASAGDEANSEAGKTDTVSLSCASGIAPRPIAWSWRDWLALGKLHIIAGPPGAELAQCILICSPS